MAVYTNNSLIKLPGFCDVHVHFREPGFFYKETIATGSRAAARGGYTAVCTMPNLDPVPDSLEHLKVQKSIIDSDAVINIYPYGAITVGEKGEVLSDIDNLSSYVVAFSDDGKGVQDPELMKEAMLRVKAAGKMVVAHCEENSLLHGGYIHAGSYATSHGHAGIVSESEWRPIERDIKLAEETGCPYHVCHISCKESVELIRDAQKSGVDISCETGPHYLLLTQDELKEDGWFKMNPPLRDRRDRDALIEGICDGTIGMIATDHAPHSLSEKAKGLKDSAFGIVGIETAFPLMYTYLVKKGIITLDKLTALLTENPRKRFNIPVREDDYCIWDLDDEYEIDPEEFLSMGRATPFAGWKVQGRCLETWCGGSKVYSFERK